MCNWSFSIGSNTFLNTSHSEALCDYFNCINTYFALKAPHVFSNTISCTRTLSKTGIKWFEAGSVWSSNKSAGFWHWPDIWCQFYALRFLTFTAVSWSTSSEVWYLHPAAHHTHTHTPPAAVCLFPLCVRLEAGGGRGVDVSAGPAGPLPEDAGDWPGIRPGQEGGARPVSCSAHISAHTWLSEELKPLWSEVFVVSFGRVSVVISCLCAGGIMRLRTRSPRCRARPRTEPTPTAAKSRPTCPCSWRQRVASTHRWDAGRFRSDDGLVWFTLDQFWLWWIKSFLNLSCDFCLFYKSKYIWNQNQKSITLFNLLWC